MFPIAAKLFSVILAISLSLGGCGSSSPQDTVSDALGVDCSAGEAVSAQDSHGGFHGDGVSYIQLAFPDDAFLNEIRGRAGWQPLPLDEPLTILAYGLTEESEGWVVQEGPYLTGEDGEPLLPLVENGWYYFEDRHSEAAAPQDTSQVLDRHSFNFTLAIYDSDSRTLHFCEFDT